MKKNTRINIKTIAINKTQKPASDTSLIISAQKIDQALEKRKKEKNNTEEFTEWK
ncbi:hypothetical protein [Microbulbifer thermotolerans]|uniref:hypothetical protein n=1 Tax=Microbulbifer thermotolerans TaxID=252514 RepID=UPI00224B6F30|nr:hypothetical protein [Microbulbifer thermotolerans]MCX2778560.1 hypothetical protein [Microbulbifer thermotolerans]MCX2803931.1 hypothetical protein [Microbulbifer thermotolerans]